MKNSVDVRIAFSYKGEDYAPAMSVDLDAIMEVSGGLPDFYTGLARENKIDTYSYLYEVMESSVLIFENPTGIAKMCVDDGRFDMQQFEILWRERNISAQLQVIIEKHGLDESPLLMAALRDAYQLGQK